jgi:hypothetical protein
MASFSAYFMRLADRCIGAARRSFDLDAVAEFRKLAGELIRKAEELEHIGTSVAVTSKVAKRKHRAVSFTKASAESGIEHAADAWWASWYRPRSLHTALSAIVPSRTSPVSRRRR